MDILQHIMDHLKRTYLNGDLNTADYFDAVILVAFAMTRNQ